VRPGGAIDQRVSVATHAYACMLGGPSGRTLFIATAATHDPEAAKTQKSGRIEVVDVGVPRAGLP
jgi:sugar lactone lactonase YvrE